MEMRVEKVFDMFGLHIFIRYKLADLPGIQCTVGGRKFFVPLVVCYTAVHSMCKINRVKTFWAAMNNIVKR